MKEPDKLKTEKASAISKIPRIRSCKTGKGKNIYVVGWGNIYMD